MSLEIREFSTGESSLIAGFIRRLQAADGQDNALEDDAFSAFVGQRCNQGGRDFRLAWDGPRLVGVLLSGRYAVQDRNRAVRAFRVFVDPELRGGMVGESLFETVEMQDPEGSVSWRTVIDGDWSVARRFLDARGYSPAQDVLIMRRNVVPNPVVSLPDGFRLRDAIPSVDTETVARLYNAANRRSFGFAPLDVDELSETMETPGGRLLVVVDEQDEIVGSAQTLPGFNSVGILHAIQVLPEFQGRGLGQFLVAAAIDVLTRSGFRVIELSVDAGNLLAVNMYRKLGFDEWSRDSVFEKNSL